MFNINNIKGFNIQKYIPPFSKTTGGRGTLSVLLLMSVSKAFSVPFSL